MSVPRSFPPSAFPSFHLHEFTHSSLPTKLDDLSTKEIALSWLLLDNLDTTTRRKLLRIWRARREKERGSSEPGSSPIFELLDLDWEVSEDMDLNALDSAQLAALPLHPNYKPSMDDNAREIFQRRRNQPETAETEPTISEEEPVPPPQPVESEPAAVVSELPQIPSIAADDAPSAPTQSREHSPSTGSASGSALPSTVPSSPAATPPEASNGHEPSEANLALNRWMSIEKPIAKTDRPHAVDSFEWQPEPPRSIPVPSFQTLTRRSISPFEESPSPTPEPGPELQEEWLTEQQTTSFFDQLLLGTDNNNTEASFSNQPNPSKTQEEESADANSISKAEDRLDAQPQDHGSKEISASSGGDSLLQRISGARPPSPAPSSATSRSKKTQKSKAEIPKGCVPREITRSWCTFLVHSIINRLPEDEIRSIIARPDLPEPVAIQIKRNPPGKRFCLVFVAFDTPQDRDLSAAGLEGFSYGFQGLKLIIKPVDKPAAAYDWDWVSTSEKFRQEYFERQRSREASIRDRSPKRRRLSSPVSNRRRSISPPRHAPLPPPSSSYRGRSPSPRRPLSPPPVARGYSPAPPPAPHRQLSPAPRDRYRRSPPPALPPSSSHLPPRGRSRSPVRQRRRSSPPRFLSPLDEPVPAALVDKLYSMILNNLPNDVNRQDVTDFFPCKTVVGIAINHPEDRRYLAVGAQRPIAHGSIFLLFETGADRERFARLYCSKKTFKGSPVPLWYDFKTKRLDPWIWRELMEDFALRNGGPPPTTALPPPPLPAHSRDLSPPPRYRRDSPGRPYDLPPPALDRYARPRDPSYDDFRSSRAPPPPSDHHYYPRSREPSPRPYSRLVSDYAPPPAPSDTRYARPPPDEDGRYAPAPARHRKQEPRPVPPARKRATWSEEPIEPQLLPPPPPVVPVPAPPSTQYHPYPLPPEPYYPPPLSTHAVAVEPMPFALPPSSNTSFYTAPSPIIANSPASSSAADPYFNPQALQSSAARYGYSGVTEIKRG
ncbi:hypothetical protein JCM3765_002032 [Sporobolomyces pararoseus]